MCEHCGCRGIAPIAQLMDEHFELLEVGARLRRAAADADHAHTRALVEELRQGLVPHARREERGIFAGLRATGEFVDAVDALEAEHASFEETLDGLDPAAPGFRTELHGLLDHLALHIDQENLGIFPVAVVTLGADGWQMVEEAHHDHEHDHDHQHDHSHEHSHEHGHEHGQPARRPDPHPGGTPWTATR